MKPPEGVIVYKTATSKYWLMKNGVLYVKIKKDSEQTLQDAQENLRTFRQVARRDLTPVLVNLEEAKSINAEAREYYSGDEYKELHNATAILIGNPVSKVLGNIFLGLNNIGVPTRLFTNEEKALKWLEEYLD